jgi:uncharacterized protein YbjT (DUF2867 family)
VISQQGVFRQRLLHAMRPDLEPDRTHGRQEHQGQSAIGQRVQQHRAVIDAAQGAGVKLLAYTSVLHADTSVLALADAHRATEAAIHASGVPCVLLRNGWYT